MPDKIDTQVFNNMLKSAEPDKTMVNLFNQESSDDTIDFNEILNKNKSLDFVQRLLDPSLNKGKSIFDEEGYENSHLMTYDEKTNRVFPTVVNKGGSSFEPLEWEVARDYADSTGEFIQVPDSLSAANLSKWKPENFTNYYKDN